MVSRSKISPICVDFINNNKLLKRGKKFQEENLIKAEGTIDGGRRPIVYDLTAGLGKG